MQVSVDLQPPFSYSVYPIIILIGILCGLTVYFLKIYIFNKKAKKQIEIVEIINKDTNQIKVKTLKELDNLEKEINDNKIHSRRAYQKLSVIIRLFVKEVTNINVQNYTLREIKELNIPILYELIKEYYMPEFSRYFLGNIKVSLQKTRKVIEKWN